MEENDDDGDDNFWRGKMTHAARSLCSAKDSISADGGADDDTAAVGLRAHWVGDDGQVHKV